MPTEEAVEAMEKLIGTVLVAMGGMAARCAGRDPENAAQDRSGRL